MLLPAAVQHRRHESLQGLQPLPANTERNDPFIEGNDVDRGIPLLSGVLHILGHDHRHP